MLAVANYGPPPDTDGPRATSRLSLLASVVIVLAALVSVAITLPGAWLILVTILIGLSVMPWYTARRHDLITSLLCIAVGVTAVDYLLWRIEVTNWAYWELVATPLLVSRSGWSRTTRDHKQEGDQQHVGQSLGRRVPPHHDLWSPRSLSPGARPRMRATGKDMKY
jgi:hypothetical protein